MTTKDYTSWRQTLALDMSSNSENRFSQKRRVLANKLLQSSFPDPTILKYYTHPVVSPETTIRQLQFEWKKPDIETLAQLCKELFEWDSKWGMCKFMRCITPGLLVWNLVNGTTITTSTPTPPPHVSKPPLKGKTAQTKPLTDFFKPTKAPPAVKPTVQEPPKQAPQILGIHAYRTHPSTDLPP